MKIGWKGEKTLSARRLERLHKRLKEQTMLRLLNEEIEENSLAVAEARAEWAKEMLRSPVWAYLIRQMNEAVLQEIYATEEQDHAVRQALWIRLRDLTDLQTSILELVSDYETSVMIRNQQLASLQDEVSEDADRL